MHTKHNGFTLMELALVLIIIGLIVGGIMVGQDLIKASEIRGTVAQLDKYTSAVNAFRVKYNAIPGDMQPSLASQLGFLTLAGTRAGTVGYGDGNGQVTTGGAGFQPAIGEPVIFWRHLSDAQLIENMFGANIVTSGATDGSADTVAITAANNGTIYPAIKNNHGYWRPIAFPSAVGTVPASVNAFITQKCDFAMPAGTASACVGTFTPLELLAIDQKLDDGMPNTGIVMARSSNNGTGSPLVAATATSGKCIIGASATDTTAIYNVLADSTGSGDYSCNSWIKGGF